jgi:hypothetical protein
MSDTTSSGLDIMTLERLSEMYYQTYLDNVREFKEAADKYASDPTYAHQLRVESTLRNASESYTRHRAFYIHYNPVDSFR